MKRLFPLFFLMTQISIALAQDSLAKYTNCEVVNLGIVTFKHPILFSIDDQHKDIINREEDFAYLLTEKSYFDTILNEKTASYTFDPHCFVYYYFFPGLIRDQILPNIKQDSCYRLLSELYPNRAIFPYYNLTKNLETFYVNNFEYWEYPHHKFVIILVNAKTYNEYEATVSPTRYKCKYGLKENGIYYKIAIPIPDE